MKLEEKEILRKKRILEYAEACGNVLNRPGFTGGRAVQLFPKRYEKQVPSVSARMRLPVALSPAFHGSADAGDFNLADDIRTQGTVRARDSFRVQNEWHRRRSRSGSYWL